LTDLLRAAGLNPQSAKDRKRVKEVLAWHGLSCQKPIAHDVDVLSSIRKTGSYSRPGVQQPPPPQLTNLELIDKLGESMAQANVSLREYSYRKKHNFQKKAEVRFLLNNIDNFSISNIPYL